MNDFQTRTTELLEQLRADLNTTMDAQFQPKFKQTSFYAVIGLESLSSSEKLTLQCILERKNKGDDNFTTRELRQILPFTRVSVGRHVKHLLDLNMIVKNGNTYSLNEKEIY